jgi:hypothetical protein
MTVLTDEEWTAEDLYSCSIKELRMLADETGIRAPYGATKADLVALLLGDIAQVVPSADDICNAMLREAAQLRSWVRGVPPGHACLTPHDMSWLQQRDVSAVWARAVY